MAVLRPSSFFLVLFVCLAFLCPVSRSQENPYIVAYDHYLEEPGNLEIEYFSTFGTQRGGNDFHAFWTEFEYGATAWWTTELYLDGQTTFSDSTIFTGVKWENRFRPLKHEHFVNPVLYIEYEHKSGADKILKEGEGHDVESDFLTPNSEARKEHINEMELKLLLSSTLKGWNFVENTLAAKDLSEFPLGIRLCPWRQPSTSPKSLRQTLHLLPPELHRWRRNVWWPRGSPQLRSPQHFALPCPSPRMESALRLDHPPLCRLRLERPEPSLPAPLGPLPGNHRLQFHGQPPLRGPSMKLYIFSLILTALFLIVCESYAQQSKSPAYKYQKDALVYAELNKAPEKARARRNPLESDPDSHAAGKYLFEDHCAECHGDTAEGGKKGPSLRADEVQNASPGTIFWVLTNGVVRRGMPVWSKLPEPQRWQLVTYIKSLGRASTKP